MSIYKLIWEQYLRDYCKGYAGFPDKDPYNRDLLKRFAEQVFVKTTQVKPKVIKVLVPDSMYYFKKVYVEVDHHVLEIFLDKDFNHGLLNKAKDLDNIISIIGPESRINILQMFTCDHCGILIHPLKDNYFISDNMIFCEECGSDILESTDMHSVYGYQIYLHPDSYGGSYEGAIKDDLVDAEQYDYVVNDK